MNDDKRRGLWGWERQGAMPSLPLKKEKFTHILGLDVSPLPTPPPTPPAPSEGEGAIGQNIIPCIKMIEAPAS